MNRSAEQTNRPRTASRFMRFVCPALRFIPHEPRKKDTHSLSIRFWWGHTRYHRDLVWYWLTEAKGRGHQYLTISTWLHEICPRHDVVAISSISSILCRYHKYISIIRNQITSRSIRYRCDIFRYLYCCWYRLDIDTNRHVPVGPTVLLSILSISSISNRYRYDIVLCL